MPDHGRHGHPGHRQRARRGLVRGAVLRLLAERPMHGYELIGELEERTGGRWRPSPGSMYPALSALEDEGLIRQVVGDADDKKRYELTAAGQTWLAEHTDDPFEPGRPGDGGHRGERAFGFPGGRDGFGGRGELRRAVGEVFGQLRQIGRFGTPAQIEQAEAILAQARTELYQLLANPPAEPTEPAGDDTPET